MKLNQLTVIEAVAGLKSGLFSSVELTKACIDRIKQVDPKLNAFVTQNDHALDEARASDETIQKEGSKAFTARPLLGVPFAIKDNFLTKDLRTTASSKVLDTYLPTHDATVVKKLKAAGMVILGKTNMDAWAHGSSTETSDYGPTKNPWHLNHLPGGSSGGSAAAVAADMCIAAVGTETAGSIRQPAAWCGITGVKPTYGRVSRYGVVSMASSTDSPGPMTKTVEDSAYILPLIAGKDPYDATTIPTPFSLNLEEIKAGVKGMKIGLPLEYLLKDMDPAVTTLIKQAATKLEELGAIVEETSLLDPKYAIGVYTILQRSEVSSNLGRYTGIRYGLDRSLFGEEAKKRQLLGAFSLSTGYYDEYYKKAQRVRTLIVEDFARAFARFDAIIGPVSPGPALEVGASEGQAMFGEMQDMLVEASSIAGLTGTSIPCGFVDGLPIGLQITGPQQAETPVLRISYAYEQATDWHKEKPNL